MRRPEIRGFLFRKPRRLIDPIRTFKVRRESNLSECAKPIFAFAAGESTDGLEFFLDFISLRRKLEVVIDCFAQQIRQKAQGELSDRFKVRNDQSARFWRVLS